MHKNVPFIALTATATEAIRKTIIKDLCIRDCVQILGDPNKQNIRYTVKDVDHKNLYDTFKPIINELEEKQINTTKVMKKRTCKGVILTIYSVSWPESILPSH